MKTFDRAIISLILIAALTAPIYAQYQYMLEGATVIGAAYGQAMKDYVVIVEGDRIIGVGTKNQVIVPPNTPVIDLKGKYLMPGLIDVHAHEQALSDWTKYLSWGVTSVNCMFEASDTALSREKWSRPDSVHSPSIYGSAPIFSIRGGLWEGEGFADDHSVNRFPETPAEARAAVRTLREKGIQRLTVIYDDVGWCRDPLPVLKKMDTEIMSGILGEARVQGLNAGVRAPLLSDARRALDFGMTALVNGIIDEPTDATFISEFSFQTVYYTPTLGMYYSLADVEAFMSHVLSDPRFLSSLDTSTVSMFRSSEYGRLYRSRYPNTEFVSSHMKIARGNVERLLQNYVQVVLGSDMPALPGIGTHLELEYLVGAGLTPMQALVSSTLMGARFLGIISRTGTIELGKDADLLILDANPLEDIRNTRAINTIIKKGTMYTPAMLRGDDGP